MLDLDADRRRENLDYVSNQLAVADEVGARCCVNIAGSYNPTTWWGPHPDNLSKTFFDQTVENVRKVIDQVKPRRTTFALEMMNWCLPDSVDAYVELLLAVGRPAFAVHLDPVNIINCPARYYDPAEVLRECFERLGDKIVSCHAKDIIIREDEPILHFDEVAPGQGAFDFHTYLDCLSRLPQEPPLCIEHLQSNEEYAQGRDHIKAVAAACGLTFDS